MVRAGVFTAQRKQTRRVTHGHINSGVKKHLDHGHWLHSAAAKVPYKSASYCAQDF